jgi:dihydrofolate reductase
MLDIVLYIATSLDGYIAIPDGCVDWFYELVGGASAAASFRSAYLITEYFLSIMPVMLGDGIPLFSQTASKSNLALVNSDIFESGVVQLTYRVKSSDASVSNR